MSEKTVGVVAPSELQDPQEQPTKKKPEQRAVFPQRTNFRKVLVFSLLGLGMPLLLQVPLEAQEGTTNYADIMPNQDDPAVQQAIADIITIRERNTSEGLPNVLIIGDSVAVQVNPQSSMMTLENWSEQSTSFGNYPDPEGRGFIPQATLLSRIDAMENKPEFVLLMFGRNDANLINIQNALDLLNNHYDPATGRVVGTGYDANWLNEILSLIQELKRRGIEPVLMGSTETPTDDSELMNVILCLVAEKSALPFIDAGDQPIVGQNAYGFTYGRQILTRGAQIDGVHFDPDVYPALNRLIAGSLENINMLTLPRTTVTTTTSVNPTTDASTTVTNSNNANTTSVSVSQTVRDSIRATIPTISTSGSSGTGDSSTVSTGSSTTLPTSIEQSIADRAAAVARRGQ